MKTSKLYGKAVLSAPDAIKARHADHILGGQLLWDEKDRPSAVGIQFLSEGETIGLTLDFPNAMFLLSILKSMQLDTGFPFPDDPRGKAS